MRCCAFSLSRVWPFVIPWTVPCQAPLSIRILQARILECVAMPSSMESSQPRDRTQVSHSAGGFFYHLSHQESLGVRIWWSKLEPGWGSV